MKTIDDYIYIDHCLIDNSLLFASLIDTQQILIVTDTNVKKLYLDRLLHTLSNYESAVVTLPSGEEHKTWVNVEMIINKLTQNNYDRSCTIIALGGGVICDMAAFAASIYMRGVNLILVPTTLLAQIDAAVGGKTGCNYAGIKNLLGTFYHPKAVIVDLDTLGTLPVREYVAGLAEVVKYGISMDADFFVWLEQNRKALRERCSNILPLVIQRCCELKLNVVRLDERDHNLRWQLNFGHTFAHAIESATNFAVYSHGEAVAIGMLLASALAVKLGMLEQEIMDRLGDLLVYLSLPIEIDSNVCSPNVLCNFMRHDKKVRAGQMNLILPCALGKVVVISTKMDRKCLEDLCSWLKMKIISMADIGDNV